MYTMSDNSTSASSITDFKSAVHEWISIQNGISEMQKNIREKKKRQQRLDFYISTYMRDQKKEFCKINENDTLVVKRKKTTGALKKDHVLKFLNTLVKDEEKANEYTKQLYGMREIKEKDYITRIHT